MSKETVSSSSSIKKVKAPRRRSPSTTDEQMLDLQDSPVYGIDLSQDTRLHELHSRLVEIEDRIRFFIETPISLIKKASHQIQAAVLEKLPPMIREKIEAALRGELGKKRRHAKRAN